jgi:hypothetical protein
LSLTDVVVEFLMDLWRDEGIPETAAKSFTDWAISEMLPSTPLNLGANGALLATARSRVVLSHATIHGCIGKSVDRAHKGLRAIASALAIDDTEYWVAISEVINGV